MSSYSRRTEMLANGPIGKTLFALSAPAVVGMTVMAIYNIADTYFVSLLRDTAAVAATGIVFPLFQLIGAVGLTFGMGAASVISRRLGANQRTAAEEAGATALYSALGVGIALSITGAIFIEPILTAFGATETILAEATLYGRVIIGGSVFQILNMTLNNLLRSEGASLHSSFGQVTGAVLNIILDPLFIFVLDMGVTGAAVATVIAQSISTLILLGYYFSGHSTLNPLRLTHFRANLATYRAIMALGVPTFVRQILGSISFGILNNAAGAYGDSAIAAVSVTLRLFMLLLMGLMGIAQGLQPLAGYNYGAKRYDRVRTTLRIAFLAATIVGIVAGVPGFAFAPAIMRVFAPHDAAVVAMGTIAIRIMSVVLVPVGLAIMFGGVFQALGNGRSALLLAAGQQGLFLIPLTIVLPRLLGVIGVLAALPSGFFVAFLLGLLLLRRTLNGIASESEPSAPQSVPLRPPDDSASTHAPVTEPAAPTRSPPARTRSSPNRAD